MCSSGGFSRYHLSVAEFQIAAASDEEVARTLAEKLVRSADLNGAEADQARAELAMVSRTVSDLVADDLVRRMQADALAVCAVFSNHTVPLWFASSRDKLVAGLEAARSREPIVGSFLMILNTMQVRKESLENASTRRRLLSVLSRPWVIGFIWLPAFALLGAAFSVDSWLARLLLILMVGVLFTLAYAVDARIRRCPSCHRYLAAMAVGAQHTGTHTESVQVTTSTGSTGHVNQSVDSYATLWRCVHCKHRWQS